MSIAMSKKSQQFINTSYYVNLILLIPCPNKYTSLYITYFTINLFSHVSAQSRSLHQSC